MYVHDLSTGKRLHTFDLGCSAVMQVSYKKKLPQVITWKYYGYSFRLMFMESYADLWFSSFPFPVLLQTTVLHQPWHCRLVRFVEL